MSKKYNFAVLSDMHSISLGWVLYTIKSLAEKYPLDGVVLNGDIISEKNGELKPNIYLKGLLKTLSSYKFPVYVAPGSHEVVSDFEPIVKVFSEKYSNLIYTVDNPVIEGEGYTLLFLPGSDWRVGKAFDEGYILTDKELKSEQQTTQENKKMLFREININSLRDYAKGKDVSRIILFSYVPKKCSGKNAPDYAEYGVITEDFEIEGTHLKKGGIVPRIYAEFLKKYDKPVEIFEGNRGNESLDKVIKEIGITKDISGHFHESVFHAQNLEGKVVSPKTPSDSLFLNASYMDKVNLSLVTYDTNKNKIAYFPVDLSELI